MIQDLPDINEIEGDYQQYREPRRESGQRDNYLDYSHRGSDVNTSKFIRQKQSLMNESGMRLVEPYQNIEGYASYNNAYSTGPASNYPPQYPQSAPTDPNQYYQNGTAINPYPFREGGGNIEIMEGYEPTPQVQGNCRDIAEHVKNCQVCGKLYNTDKTIYIIAIVLLLIICAILLRKILNV
jgi:hypothetical protein